MRSSSDCSTGSPARVGIADHRRAAESGKRCGSGDCPSFCADGVWSDFVLRRGCVRCCPGGFRRFRRCGRIALVVSSAGNRRGRLQGVWRDRRPDGLNSLEKLLRLLGVAAVDHAHRRTATAGRHFAQLGQQAFYFGQFDGVRPQQQAIVLHVGLDAEFPRLLLFLRRVAVVPGAALLFLLRPAAQHDVDRARHVIGGETAEADDFELAFAAGQLVRPGADRHVVGQRGVGDDRRVLLVRPSSRVVGSRLPTSIKVLTIGSGSTPDSR